MMPTRSPGLRPRSCSSPATRALASSRARYVIAALSTRTATRPAWVRVVSVRFLARFVTPLIVRRATRAVVGPWYQACPRALVRRHNRCAGGPRKGSILVLPARYRRVRRSLASWITRRKEAGWTLSAATRWSLAGAGSRRKSSSRSAARSGCCSARLRTEHHGVRCPDRDPAGQPEQVRGRPRKRPDPSGPDEIGRAHV